MRIFITYFLILLSFTMLAQETDLIHFMNDGKVYLRWGDVQQSGFDGYNIYKSTNSNDWEKLNETPITLQRDINAIRVLAGYKTDLFLQLFGIEEQRSITDADYQNFLSNTEAVEFMRIITLVNPELGYLLGTIYVDESPGNQPIQYKVTAIINNKEKDWATSENINPNRFKDVPSISGFEAEAANQQAKLRWDKHKAEMKSGEVVTYNVYRSEIPSGPYERINASGILPVKVTSGDKTFGEDLQTYTEKHLENGKTYYFYVKAVNAFGFESVKTPTIKVIPENKKAPLPPFNIEIKQLALHAQLNWEAFKKEEIKGFEVYKSDNRDSLYTKVYPVDDLLLSNRTTWTDFTINEGQHIYYYLQSVGKNDERSEPSDTLHFYLSDTRAPKTPSGLIAIADTGLIHLEWNANTETDLAGYKIERTSDDDFKQFFLLNTNPIQQTTYTDTLPKMSETIYSYRIFAIDENFNKSAPTELVKVKMPDVKPPVAPIITTLNKKGNEVDMTWTQSSATDFSHFHIYRSTDHTKWELRGTTVEISFTDTIHLSGEYYYTICSVDQSNNESKIETWWTVKYDQNKNPVPPENGKIEVKNGRLVISWDEVNHPETKGFLISRLEVRNNKYVDLKEVPANRLYYVDLNAHSSKTYTYFISTFNEKGIYSDQLKLEYTPNEQ